MWLCKQCGFINNNSSLKCHAPNCKGTRDVDAKELPVAITRKKIETVIDWCPVCDKEQFFEKAGRKRFRTAWRCCGCHKLYHKFGSYKSKKVGEIIK